MKIESRNISNNLELAVEQWFELILATIKHKKDIERKKDEQTKKIHNG